MPFWEVIGHEEGLDRGIAVQSQRILCLGLSAEKMNMWLKPTVCRQDPEITCFSPQRLLNQN